MGSRWSPKSEPRRLHARRSWACASRVESHQLRLDSGGAKRPEPRFKPKRARATRRTDPKCKLLSSTAAQPCSVPNYVLATHAHAVGRTEETEAAVSRSRLFIKLRRCPDENGMTPPDTATHVDPSPYTVLYFPLDTRTVRSTTPHPPLHRPTCPRRPRPRTCPT